MKLIREVAEMGMISSFCTAGYRCGRTGDKIIACLKVNAVLKASSASLMQFLLSGNILMIRLHLKQKQ
jgi:hypothetical protein